MRSVCIAKGWMVVLALSSCAEPKEEKSFFDFFENADKNSSLFISVFNKNDCMMCYGAIDAQFFSIIDSFNIPHENVVAYFSDTRRKETDRFFSSNLSGVKSSNFSQVLVSNKDLEVELERRTDLKICSSSFYVIVSPEGELLEATAYK